MIDSATRLRDNRIHLFDPVGLMNDAYYANHSIGSKRATTATSADDGSSPLMFAVKSKGEFGVDSDDSSPKLWKMSPAASPPPEPMSPNSRTEAIARGRRELMEMIKDMPESLYELSLRDIVDRESTTPVVADDEKKKLAPMADLTEKKKKKVVVSKKMARSRSADNGGYLLKTSVFPISFGMRRRKKRSLISTGSLKAGATSAAAAGKSAEKDWWRRKPSESDISGGLSSSSDSGGSSGSSSRSSSSSSRRHGQSNRFLPGCCSFRTNK